MSHFRSETHNDLTDWSEPKISPGDLVEVLTPLDYNQVPDRELGVVLEIDDDEINPHYYVHLCGESFILPKSHLRKLG